MTYSHNRDQSPSLFNTNPLQSNDAYFAALAPVLRAAAVIVMSLMARLCKAFDDSLRYKSPQNNRKRKAAILAVILFMILLKGSREEKTEFFNRVCEKLHAARNARMKALRAEYIIWRQRKCWMWMGGFMNAALTLLPDVFAGAADEHSFDALIPD